jgi:hypothetical protein
MTRYSTIKEADAEKLLVAGIKALKGKAFKLKFLGLSGAPDRLILLPKGKFYFVELKKEGGKLESSQAIMFPILEKLGFKVHVLVGSLAVRLFIDNLRKEQNES